MVLVVEQSVKGRTSMVHVWNASLERELHTSVAQLAMEKQIMVVLFIGLLQKLSYFKQAVI